MGNNGEISILGVQICFPNVFIIDTCALNLVLSLAIEASRVPARFSEFEAVIMACLQQSLFDLPL